MADKITQDTEPFLGVRAEFDISALRLIADQIRRNKGGFSSEQVKAFLLLYDEELHDRVKAAVRKFLEDKLA
jgi:hypothetical protein